MMPTWLAKCASCKSRSVLVFLVTLMLVLVQYLRFQCLKIIQTFDVFFSKQLFWSWWKFFMLEEVFIILGLMFRRVISIQQKLIKNIETLFIKEKLYKFLWKKYFCLTVHNLPNLCASTDYKSHFFIFFYFRPLLGT